MADDIPEDLSDAEAEKIIDELIDECQMKALAIFNDMKARTCHKKLAGHGLQAYIYGVLMPMFASLYIAGRGKDTEDMVKKLVIDMMSTLTEETDKRRKKAMN